MGPRGGLEGCGKLASTGIRLADRPVRSKSLYRLHSPSPLSKGKLIISTWRRYTSTRLGNPYREHLDGDLEVLDTCCVIVTQIKRVISKN